MLLICVESDKIPLLQKLKQLTWSLCDCYPTMLLNRCSWRSIEELFSLCFQKTYNWLHNLQPRNSSRGRHVTTNLTRNAIGLLKGNTNLTKGRSFSTIAFLSLCVTHAIIARCSWRSFLTSAFRINSYYNHATKELLSNGDTKGEASQLAIAFLKFMCHTYNRNATDMTKM